MYSCLTLAPHRMELESTSIYFYTFRNVFINICQYCSFLFCVYFFYRLKFCNHKWICKRQLKFCSRIMVWHCHRYTCSLCCFPLQRKYMTIRPIYTCNPEKNMVCLNNSCMRINVMLKFVIKNLQHKKFLIQKSPLQMKGI